MFISNNHHLQLVKQIDELEKLVLELAGWASYENSVHAKRENLAKIREIRDRRKGAP